MLVIPYNTDAPLYHPPWGTIGLMVLNAVVWLVLPPEEVSRWALPHGMGWTPLQWCTSLFVHASLLHLLGNLFFLWGFGLIVEGKAGLWGFLGFYLSLGVTASLLEQGVFLSGEPTISLGASSVIYGLMGLALIWAPWNEVFILYAAGLKWGQMELSVVAFSGLLLLKSLFVGLVGGVPLQTESLHLLGSVLGLGLGLLALQFRWVDCEGWDLLTLIRQGTPSLPLEHERDAALRSRPSILKRSRRNPRSARAKGLDRVRELLDAGKPLAAWRELQLDRQTGGSESLNPEHLLQLARGLRSKREWQSAVICYQEYLKAVATAAPAIQLELAEILVLVQERPQAALQLLRSVLAENLSDQDATRLLQLRQQAEQLIAEGVLELREPGYQS